MLVCAKCGNQVSSEWLLYKTNAFSCVPCNSHMPAIELTEEPRTPEAKALKPKAKRRKRNEPA
jgi:hypothetical protein